MLDEKYTGNGKVVLLAGGGKIYTDIAARFVRSERSLEEIVASPYSRQIVRNILESGHRAALEFDFFLFGVEGYSRVTETQLVRKRLASYLIKSGRAELGGKRRFSVVYPASVRDFGAEVTLPAGTWPTCPASGTTPGWKPDCRKKTCATSSPRPRSSRPSSA